MAGKENSDETMYVWEDSYKRKIPDMISTDERRSWVVDSALFTEPPWFDLWCPEQQQRYSSHAISAIFLALILLNTTGSGYQIFTDFIISPGLKTM